MLNLSPLLRIAADNRTLMASPVSPHAAGANPVMTAIRAAGAATGAGVDFLTHMARRESALDPNAKAGTSSAAGLFQFIEQTWLGALKSYGARHGYGDFAADITRGADGRLTVADEARRAEILNLRFDANASARLAGELTNENRSYLERALGRAAHSADLYAAHFLGPAGAVKLLSAAGETVAADLLPQAAAANRPVFYDGDRARSVSEVVANIARTFAKGTADAAATPARDPARSAVIASEFAAQPIAEAAGAHSRPRVRSEPVATSAPALTASIPAATARLSTLALAALFALDPTALIRGADRNDGDNPEPDRF